MKEVNRLDKRTTSTKLHSIDEKDKQTLYFVGRPEGVSTNKVIFIREKRTGIFDISVLDNSLKEKLHTGFDSRMRIDEMYPPKPKKGKPRKTLKAQKRKAATPERKPKTYNKTKKAFVSNTASKKKSTKKKIEPRRVKANPRNAAMELALKEAMKNNQILSSSNLSCQVT